MNLMNEEVERERRLLAISRRATKLGCIVAMMFFIAVSVALVMAAFSFLQPPQMANADDYYQPLMLIYLMIVAFVMTLVLQIIVITLYTLFLPFVVRARQELPAGDEE